MSKAQSGVPGPGEMTTLSYVPDDRRSNNAGQVSLSLVITFGSAVTCKHIGQPAAQSVVAAAKGRASFKNARQQLPPFTSDIS